MIARIVRLLSRSVSKHVLVVVYVEHDGLYEVSAQFGLISGTAEDAVNNLFPTCDSFEEVEVFNVG